MSTLLYGSSPADSPSTSLPSTMLRASAYSGQAPEPRWIQGKQGRRCAGECAHWFKVAIILAALKSEWIKIGRNKEPLFS